MICFIAALLITMVATYALASDTILACSQQDGSVVYTNKDVKGCMPVSLPELSVVPSYDVHPSIVNKPFNVIIPPVIGKTSSPINDRLCSMYNEWMLINDTTQGGSVFTGVDQKIRYHSLWRTFSSGFISVDCRQ
jgi:hypothetical protein